MKKFLRGLSVFIICGALNFGLTNDAQAAELDKSIELNGAESQELSRHHYGPPPPPPRHRHWRHMPPPPPPPPHGDYWNNPPPPPPPPPPPHRW